MKISTKYRPELACADTDRPALSQCYLAKDRIVATNGHMMVVVPCARNDNDTDGPIDPAVLTRARKLAKRTGEVEIVANGSYTLTDGSIAPRLAAGEFLPWEQIMSSANYADDDTVTFALDATLLAKLAKSLGAANVILRVKRPAKGEDMLDPIAVRGHDRGADADAIGLLMPLRSR